MQWVRYRVRACIVVLVLRACVFLLSKTFLSFPNIIKRIPSNPQPQSPSSTPVAAKVAVNPNKTVRAGATTATAVAAEVVLQQEP